MTSTLACYETVLITAVKSFIAQAPGVNLLMVAAADYPFKDRVKATEIIVYNIERANMHCMGTACARSFEIVQTSSEGQKLECFK